MLAQYPRPNRLLGQDLTLKLEGVYTYLNPRLPVGKGATGKQNLLAHENPRQEWVERHLNEKSHRVHILDQFSDQILSCQRKVVGSVAEKTLW
jgi:hypothetical protein